MAGTKSVFDIRHAEHQLTKGAGVWQPQAPLKPAVWGRIGAAADYFHSRGIEFNQFFHTEFTRSRQTCLRLCGMFNAGLSPVTESDMLGLGWIGKWEVAHKKWLANQVDTENPPDLQPAEMVKIWRELCQMEGMRHCSAIRDIAKSLKPGENAAAISHSPLMNLAEAMMVVPATGKPVRPEPRPRLDYCQAIEFRFDENNRFLGTEFHAS